MRLAAALIAALPPLAALHPQAASAQDWASTDSAAIFAGRMTGDVWEDVFLSPTELDIRDSTLIGLAVAREWRRAGSPLSWGAELQVVSHTGEQDHLEVALPLTVRWHLPVGDPGGSLAFGLGLSYATDPPEVELDRSGETQRTLAYWMIEAEIGPGPGRISAFVRLHHRSNAFGLFEPDAGSNALVLGLRRRW